jgi:hypothetical protein
VAGGDDDYIMRPSLDDEWTVVITSMWHVHNMMMAHSWSSVELWKQQLTTLPFSAVRPRGVSQQHAASQEASSA